MGKARNTDRKKKTKYTFKTAAYHILKEFKRPMNAKELTRVILKRKMVETDGKTPDRTLSSLLYNEIRKKKENSLFVNVDKGIFTLSEFQEDAKEFNKMIHLVKDFPKVMPNPNRSDRYNEEYGYEYLKYFLYINSGKSSVRRKRENVCFVCKSEDPPPEREDDNVPDHLINCKRCEKMYHLCCLNFEGETFYCPRHVCHRCEKRLKKKKLVRCLTCPMTFCTKCVRELTRKEKRKLRSSKKKKKKTHKIKKMEDEGEEFQDSIICEYCLPFFNKEIETKSIEIKE